MPSMSKTREDSKLDLAAEILRRRGSIRLKVWGTSMLPSLWPGDLLTIQGLAYDQAVPGDIVLVLRNNRFFVHRLIERRRDQDCLSWITKGDAMQDCDPPAAASELLGRVAGIRRGNRSFVPSPRVSQPHSALAWMLYRWNRLRNLTMRIHAARLRVNPPRARQVFRRVFTTVRWIPGITPSHTFRQ
jgi:signal peptidase